MTPSTKVTRTSELFHIIKVSFVVVVYLSLLFWGLRERSISRKLTWAGGGTRWGKRKAGREREKGRSRPTIDRRTEHSREDEMGGRQNGRPFWVGGYVNGKMEEEDGGGTSQREMSRK